MSGRTSASDALLLQRQVGNQAVAELLSGRLAVPAARLVSPATGRLLQRGKKKKDKQPPGKQGGGTPARGKKGSRQQRQAQHEKGRDASDEAQAGDEKRKVRVPQPHGGQPSKEDWALSATQAQKKDIMKRRAVPPTWKDGALHHKVSKETLAGIVDAFELVDAVRVGNAGACEFWKACRDAAGDEVLAQSDDNPYRVLWNIAMNLALGPPSPAGDPGTGFDPDTMPARGGRQLDPVSGYLHRIDAAYHAHKGDELPISDEVWVSMAKAMRKAFDAAPHGHRLAPPMTEQWIDDGTSHLRKGLKVHRGLEEARQLLADRGSLDDDARDMTAAHGGQPRGDKPKGDQPDGGQGITCSAGTWPKSRLRLVISSKAIRHICERHTYRYFQFSEIKAVNNFWPGATSVAWVRSKMDELAPYLAERCLEILLQQYEGFLTGKDHRPPAIEEGNQDLGGCLTFFNVRIEHDEVAEASGGSSDAAGKSPDQPAGSPGKALAEERKWRDVVAYVKTIAPDGKDAEFVLARDLREIGKGVVETSVRGAALRGREPGDAGGGSGKGKERLGNSPVGDPDVDAEARAVMAAAADERAAGPPGGRYSSELATWKTKAERFVTKDLLPAMAATEKEGNSVWINNVGYRVLSIKRGKASEVTGIKVKPMVKPKAPEVSAVQQFIRAAKGTVKEREGASGGEGRGPDRKVAAEGRTKEDAREKDSRRPGQEPSPAGAPISLEEIEVESDGVCLLNALVESRCGMTAEALLAAMKAVAPDVLHEKRDFHIRSDDEGDSGTAGGTVSGRRASGTDEDFWRTLTIKQLKRGGWGRNTFDLAVLIAARALGATIHVCDPQRRVLQSFVQGAPELWVIYYPDENHFNGALPGGRRPA